MKSLLMILMLLSFSFSTEINIMFTNWHEFIFQKDENALICKYDEWVLSKDHLDVSNLKSTTTIKKMYEDGWHIIDIVKINQSGKVIQMFIFFEK